MRGTHVIAGRAAALVCLSLVLTSCTDPGKGDPADVLAQDTTGATSTPSSTAAPDAVAASGVDAEAETATEVDERPAAEPPPPPGPEPAWTLEGTILSTPVEHEGDLLLHVDPPGAQTMALVSLDAATGEENWRRDAGITGLFSAGPPTLRDGLVYTFEDTGQDDQAEAVALEAGSGEEVARSTQMLRAYAQPRPCGQSEVCLSYRLPGAESVSLGHLRRDGAVLEVLDGSPYDPDAGAEESDDAQGPAEEDSVGIQVSEDWDFETGEIRIEAREAEEVVWSSSVDDHELRTDPSHTAVLGATMTMSEVYLHDVFYGEDTYGARPNVFALEEHVLLALDLGDGSPLWRATGVSLCTPGGVEVSTVITCSGDGEVINDGYAGPTTVDADDVLLSGRDVATGEVTWTQAISDEDWTALLGELPLSPDPAQTLVVVDGERVMVDVLSGDLTPAAQARLSDGFVCEWSVPWEAPDNPEDGSQRMTDRFQFPCDSTGQQVAVPTEKALSFVAQEAGGMRLVTGPDALVAFAD